jgi:predicted nucleic acid-binding protein
MSGDKVHPARSMVDTMVLSYAIKAPPVSSDSEIQEMRENSRTLLNQLQEIHVSAVCWLELKRISKFSEDEQKILDGYKNRIFIHSIDAAVAESAAALMAKHRSRAGVCPTCLNSKESLPCKKCKAKTAKSVKINDAITVAVADILEQIEVLYTYDGGMIDLGKFVDGCKVRRPPNRNGPLFDHVGEKEHGGTVLTLPPASSSADED